VDIKELTVDPFGEDGILYYHEVTREQRDLDDSMECLSWNYYNESTYDLGEGSGGCPPLAFNTRIVSPDGLTCADTGEEQLSLPGSSSFRVWAEGPNFHIDTEETQDDNKIGNQTRHILGHNGQAGGSTILREPITLAIWRWAGHPASRTAFARTRSNVWDTEYGEGTWMAHDVLMPYKTQFQKEELPEMTEVREGYGDPFGGWWEAQCEWSDGDNCDDTSFNEDIDIVANTPWEDGFADDIADVVDIQSHNLYMCLSALTGTCDDALHAYNNVVWALVDGIWTLLPWSTDISLDHPWCPQGVEYGGWDTISQGCFSDEDCWRPSIENCRSLVNQFEDEGVAERIVTEVCTDLTAADLERDPDSETCAVALDSLLARPDTLREELDNMESFLENGGFSDTGWDTGL